MEFLVLDLATSANPGLLYTGLILLLLFGGGIALGARADRMRLHTEQSERLRKAA